MALFRYKAVTPDGATVEGEMEAASQLAVVERLQAEGHLPIAADEFRKDGTAARSWFGPRRPSQATVAIMTREIATLLEAGLPLDRALEIGRDVAENATVAKLLGRILERVRGGATFSDALAEQGDFFPRLYVSTVQAGEAGGAMAPVMRRLAGFVERAAALRETVKSALIYPTILLVVVVLSIVILLTVVVPQFKPIFEDAGRDLPFATQVVVAAGDAVAAYGWLMAAGLVGLMLLGQRLFARPAFRRRIDAVLVRLPLVGDLVVRFETARFSRTLATLIENGVLLVNALAIAAETISNMALREAVAGTLPQIRAGQGLAGPLRQSGLMPMLAIQLIRVGEETGKLDEMLMKAADIYDNEVQRAVDRLLALLVPLLTVGLGVIVAGIIASLLIAVLSVNELAL
jgi:general secretion pathway protein F